MLYVSLLDTFGSQIKWPGIFRFELYQHVQRSAKRKGKRLHIWPDADLTDLATNSRYWRGFLRAYELTLPLDQSNSKSHILQVTYFCPTGKLLTDEFIAQKIAMMNARPAFGEIRTIRSGYVADGARTTSSRAKENPQRCLGGLRMTMFLNTSPEWLILHSCPLFRG